MTDTTDNTAPAAAKRGEGRRAAAAVKTEVRSIHGLPSPIPAGGPRAALCKLLDLRDPSDAELWTAAIAAIEADRDKPRDDLRGPG